VYRVTGVNFYQGRFYVYCTGRTFVKYTEEFERFLDNIVLTDKIINEMQDNIANTPAVKEAENAISTVNGGLVDMFRKLQENPTEMDLKVAGTMVSIANTLVNVGQLQLNVMKAKNNQ